METLKHYRFKSQCCINSGRATGEDVCRVISYLDCPVGVQINMLIFLIPIKDFIWSRHHYSEQMRMKQMSLTNAQIVGASSSSTCPRISEQGNCKGEKVFNDIDGVLPEKMDDETHDVDLTLGNPEA